MTLLAAPPAVADAAAVISNGQVESPTLHLVLLF
jgi:hypothetical protein